MSLWETLSGRRRLKPPQLDALFAIPSAAITVQTAMGFTPVGSGSVCYREAPGAAFAQIEADVTALLSSSSPSSASDDGESLPAPSQRLRTTRDEYGYTWLTVEEPDMSALCTDLHAVNTSLEAQGFGTALLCTMVPFVDAAGRRFALVYLYKQGTFYPFAPVSRTEQRRDNLLEINVRDQLTGELPIEPDLQRWLAVWNAPGL